MLFNPLPVLAMVAAVSQVVAAQKMPVHDFLSVIRRQAVGSRGTATGYGNSCAEAFGEGYKTCKLATANSKKTCYHPDSQTCCPEGDACPKDTRCIKYSRNNFGCCPDDITNTECAIYLHVDAVYPQVEEPTSTPTVPGTTPTSTPTTSPSDPPTTIPTTISTSIPSSASPIVPSSSTTPLAAPTTSTPVPGGNGGSGLKNSTTTPPTIGTPKPTEPVVTANAVPVMQPLVTLLVLFAGAFVVLL